MDHVTCYIGGREGSILFRRGCGLLNELWKYIKRNCHMLIGKLLVILSLGLCGQASIYI